MTTIHDAVAVLIMSLELLTTGQDRNSLLSSSHLIYSIKFGQYLDFEGKILTQSQGGGSIEVISYHMQVFFMLLLMLFTSRIPRN